MINDFGNIHHIFGKLFTLQLKHMVQENKDPVFLFQKWHILGMTPDRGSSPRCNKIQKCYANELTFEPWLDFSLTR